MLQRVGGDIAAKAGVLPAATPAVKKMLGLDLVPDAVISPFIGQLATTFSGLGM
jgi:hypothetical protein